MAKTPEDRRCCLARTIHNSGHLGGSAGAGTCISLHHLALRRSEPLQHVRRRHVPRCWLPHLPPDQRVRAYHTV